MSSYNLINAAVRFNFNSNFNKMALEYFAVIINLLANAECRIIRLLYYLNVLPV